MAIKSVTVLLDRQADRNFDTVVHELEHDGLKVDRLLRGMRTIVGEADESALERMRHRKGVAAVREEDRFTLPPLDPDIPQ